jgi:hypothetical protein
MILEIFPKSNFVISKNVIQANIPTELLIVNFDNIFFAGTMSTCMYAFSSKAQNPALIFIPREKSKWVNYISGGILKFFSHRKIII